MSLSISLSRWMASTILSNSAFTGQFPSAIPEARRLLPQHSDKPRLLAKPARNRRRTGGSTVATAGLKTQQEGCGSLLRVSRLEIVQAGERGSPQPAETYLTQP